MKKLLFLIMIILSCTFGGASAQEIMADTTQNKIAVRGTLDEYNPGDIVTIMLLKRGVEPSKATPSDILYFNTATINENGKYSLDFLCYNTPEEYTVYVKQGDNDITNTVTQAYLSNEQKCLYDLNLYDGLGKKSAVLNVDNPFSVDVTATLILSSYDSSENLIGVKLQTLNIDGETPYIYMSTECSVDTSMVKCLLWSDVKTVLPLHTAVSSQNVLNSEHKDILILGNSYSYDSTRYVHDIAESIGADIDVYLLAHAGATVYDLWKQRENNDYCLLVKNGVTAYRRVSVDTLLSEREFDAIVMQNYWGGSLGIMDYANSNYACSMPNGYVNLASYIKSKQPQAELLINSVWSNENGYNEAEELKSCAENSEFANLKNSVQRWSYNQLEKFNGQAATDCAEASNYDGALRQIPVGYAIQMAREYIGEGNYPFFTTFDDTVTSFEAMNDGDLCPISDSDAAKGRLRLNRDGYHLSFAGRYLAGLVWTGIFTGCDVTSIDYVPIPENIDCGYQSSGNDTATLDTISVSFDPLSDKHTSALRNIAAKAIQRYYEYGTRTLQDEEMVLTY